MHFLLNTATAESKGTTMNFHHIPEVKSKNDLRCGVPLRFTYRGFTVSRTNEGKGTLCFWRATRGAGASTTNLTATATSQVLDLVDKELREPA